MDYFLMHKDWRVAIISISLDDEGDPTIKLKNIKLQNRIPYFILNGKNESDNLKAWFLHRTIPQTRAGLNVILEKTGCKSAFELSLKNHCASLSDHYWVCPMEKIKTMKWNNINFFLNDFSDDIGKLIFNKSFRDSNEVINFNSPDCTTNGWLQKTWRIKDRKRLLIKAGSKPDNIEPAVEVFASRVLRELDIINFVDYNFAKINGSEEVGCFCEDFLSTITDFLPAYLVYQMEERQEDVSVADHFIKMCKKIGVQDVEIFLKKMNLVDSLFGNRDRHLGNFGFIRNINSMEIIGFAPLFDNGSSLINICEEQIRYNKENFGKLIEYDELTEKDIYPLPKEKIENLKKIATKMPKYLSMSKADTKTINSIFNTFIENLLMVEKWLENTHEQTIVDNEIINNEPISEEKVNPKIDEKIKQSTEDRSYEPDFEISYEEGR